METCLCVGMQMIADLQMVLIRFSRTVLLLLLIVTLAGQ